MEWVICNRHRPLQEETCKEGMINHDRLPQLQGKVGKSVFVSRSGGFVVDRRVRHACKHTKVLVRAIFTVRLFRVACPLRLIKDEALDDLIELRIFRHLRQREPPSLRTSSLSAEFAIVFIA